MEYIYAAMLLHKAGKQITDSNVKSIITAAGITPNEGKIKALIAALEGVNIEEAIKQVAIPISAPTESKAEDKQEKHKEEKKSDEQAAAGLGALFG
ncbi:MAG: 50S ribosomal protein P1 [archaeon]